MSSIPCMCRTHGLAHRLFQPVKLLQQYGVAASLREVRRFHRRLGLRLLLCWRRLSRMLGRLLLQLLSCGLVDGQQLQNRRTQQTSEILDGESSALMCSGNEGLIKVDIAR